MKTDNQRQRGRSRGQISKIREHDARETQILPFLRTRLTDAQRSQVMHAISEACTLLDQSQDGASRSVDIIAGAALVACSLDTGRHVRSFLNGDVDISARDYLHALRTPGWTGLCRSENGNLGWLLEASGPNLVVKAAPSKSSASRSDYDSGLVWLPTAMTTFDLLKRAESRLAELIGTYQQRMAQLVEVEQELDPKGRRRVRNSNVQSIINPFSQWFQRKNGLKIGTRILGKISADLAYRVANGPLGDPAVAHIITGKLTRESIATSHYTTVSRARAAQFYVETLQSLRPQTSFEPRPCANIPDSALALGAPEPYDDFDPDEVLEQLKKPSLPGKNASVCDLMDFHNTLTLRVWLMTSLVIGARSKAQALVNPDAILPGNLILVNDKRPKIRQEDFPEGSNGQADQSQAPCSSTGIIPTTRVIALPDHVADQIRAYGMHMGRLRCYFENGSEAYQIVADWLAKERGRARWEPLFWVEGRNDTDGTFLRYHQLSRRKSLEPLLGRIQQVRGNRWRHYLRGQLLGRLPSEIIDAHLGHWQDARGPWWEGAGLDPVETWCRIRDAIGDILPAEDWKVLTLPAQSMPGSDESQFCVLSSRIAGSARHRRMPETPAPTIWKGASPLVDLFDAARYNRAHVAFALEGEHLAWINRLPEGIEPEAYPGLLLISAILWSGLLNPATWDPWLLAVSTARQDGRDPSETVEFCFTLEGTKNLNQQQSLYHDPLTAKLCRAWSLGTGNGGMATDAVTNIRTWLAMGSLAGQADTIMEQLRHSLELRARLRMPGAIVDFASGRYPSAGWKDGQRVQKTFFDSEAAPRYDSLKATFPNVPPGRRDGSELDKARQVMATKLSDYQQQNGPADRRTLWKIFRDGLCETFGLALSSKDWFARERSLERIIARLLLEMSTAGAARRGMRLYRGVQLEAAQLSTLIEQCSELLQKPIPPDRWSELGSWIEVDCVLRDPLVIPDCREAQQTDIDGAAEAISGLVHAWINNLPSKLKDKSGKLAFALTRALCLLGRSNDADEISDAVNRAFKATKGSGKSEDDPRRWPKHASYPLVTADQFSKAMSILTRKTIWKSPVKDSDKESGRDQKSAKELDRRQSDICRISAILMFRAGVRPYELSGLSLTDLTIRCNERNEVKFAELLITANALYKRKTSLSRRVVPLDVLLEPGDVELLRNWQSLRLIEVGGRPTGQFLFAHSPSEVRHRILATWILRPIANALIEARGGYDTYDDVGMIRDEKGRRANSSAEIANYCYRLRHTAATCMMATLLLPSDAAVPSSARFPGLVPDLINPKRRERLAARLLGPGRSGQSAAHAVARILGHSDLTSLRSTYLHLMDWSLGIWAGRPALQPPLRRDVINWLERGDDKEPHTAANLRKLASRHHHRMPSFCTTDERAKPTLVLPQYRRAGRGRIPRSGQTLAVTDSGYLGHRSGFGFDVPRNSDGVCRGLVLHCSPEPHDVADLVVRAHKSGLPIDDLVGRFGIDREDAIRMLSNWNEIVRLEGLFKKNACNSAKGFFATGRTRVPLFRALDDAKWNNLASLPIQLARHPFAASFRAYSHALVTLKNPIEQKRSAAFKTARAIRILLTRRNPYDGSCDLTFETRHEVPRYIGAFESVIKANAKSSVLFSHFPLHIRLKRKVAQDLTDEADQNSLDEISLCTPEEPASKWAAYCLVLYVIHAYDDLQPFLQSMQLHWSSIRSLVRCLDPRNSNTGLVLPHWVGQRLYGKLCKAHMSSDNFQRRSSGLVWVDAKEINYGFRITNPQGDVVAGLIRKVEPEVDVAGIQLRGLTWRPRLCSTKRKHVVRMGQGTLEIVRSKSGALIICSEDEACNSSAIGKVRELIASLPINETRSTNNEVSWVIEAEQADAIEAKLFASAASPVRWDSTG